MFKARATAATTSGEELLRFFAAFYTATALIGIFIQVTALRPLLGRLGVARSASLLPAGVSLGAVGALLAPGVLAIALARGAEVVLRSSVFAGPTSCSLLRLRHWKSGPPSCCWMLARPEWEISLGAGLILVRAGLTGAAAGTACYWV